MKTLINFTLCTLCALNLCAQSSGSYLGNYAQPAPNVASLGKYVDYPVGYYTGVPQIGVPIYDLKDGSSNLSVSLSYHASGIRVSELASWVGLGWSLQAGGMISRSVRGGTDEGVWNAQATPAGYYLDSGIRKMPLLPYPTNGVISKTAADDARQNFYAQINAGNADTEPDLFTFSFGSYSGKFVFDENRTPTLLENQDLKISVSDGNFSSWTIITPDGVKYLFGESNMREVNNTYNNEVLDGHTQKPSSWMLTRIIYPNTKDTVYFNYTPEVYAYFDLGGETDLYDQSSGANAPQQACYNNPVRQFVSVVRTKMSGLRLTSIKSKNYTISFIAKTQRQDLISYSGNPYPYQLDSIKIFNSQNQCLKQYLLSYTYFTSTTATGAPTVALSTLNGDVTDTKRLKLTSVKEFSGDGLSSKPAWTFTYDETYQLPRRISYDQDHWGYSNNYSGNVNDRFMPRVNHPICTNVSGPAANRNSSWPSMKSFSLISLANPLGVVTNFEFEANNVSGGMVGGLRIHKISTIENVGGDTLVRLYDYQNSGVLYRMPEYLSQPVNEYYYTLYPQNTSYIGYDYSNYQVIRSLLKQSQSIVPLQDFQGNHIGYGSVKEIFGANGEGGSKEYNYNAYDNISSSRLDIGNYTALTTIYNGSTAMSGNYGNGHFNDITPQNLSYYFSTMLYPYAPQQVDFRRGKLTSELTYDSAGNLLKSVYNTYSENYDESKWIRGFKIFRSAIPNASSGGSSGDYNDALTFYKLHTGISHPVQTVATDYKDGKTMTTTSSYGYESAYHTLKTSDTTTNSQGDVIINKSYYSFDYANTATSDGVFTKMKSRNMLVPIGLRIWKNNTLVSGKIIQYKDFASSGTDTFVNPIKIYAVEAADPLTTAQAGESIALTGQISTLIPNSYFKEKASFNYDGTTGRMEEQKLVNDKNQVLIWDNQTLMPLAIADNAYSSNDVAYTGFETAETGNWSYSSGNVVTDATAPTGAKAYSLASAISKTALTSAKKYTLSYWYKTGAAVTITGGTQSNAITGITLNGWTYKQVNITGTTSLSLSGNGSVDEIRLYPSDGQMISYAYDGLLRLTAQCSANSTISRYEYDSFNRLIDIKDQYGNIVKAFEYNYGASNR